MSSLPAMFQGVNGVAMLAVDRRNDFGWPLDHSQGEGRESQWGRQPWPSSRLSGGDPTILPSPLVLVSWAAPKPRIDGATSYYKILMTTKDAAGAVLAGCTVKGYDTATDVEEGPAVVSKPDGAVQVGVLSSLPHYLRAYKAGSPDVAGTTRNDLVGVQ